MFDRFDICAAYWLYASHHNIGGEALHPVSGRPIFARLHRMNYQPGPLTIDHLERDESGDTEACDDYENAICIYRNLTAATT